MYKIEKNGSTFILTFDGIVRKAALDRWLQESEQALATCTGAFGVIVDMRTVKPLSPNAQAVIVQGQSLYKQAGMERSAVILNSPVLTMQFKRLAKDSGIYTFERYLDASNDENWQKHAVAWVKLGVYPEK